MSKTAKQHHIAKCLHTSLNYQVEDHFYIKEGYLASRKSKDKNNNKDIESIIPKKETLRSRAIYCLDCKEQLEFQNY